MRWQTRKSAWWLVYDAENDAMTYAITGGNTDGAFSINSSDGTITVAGTIDHDTIQQYVLDVNITEADTAEHYGETIQVTVDVNNLHDVPPTPEAADMIAVSDSGVSQTDNITNDTTPTFEGAAGSAMGGQYHEGIRGFAAGRDDHGERRRLMVRNICQPC